MFDKFDDLEEKISHLEGRLSDPSLMDNQKEYQNVVREHAHFSRLQELFSAYKKVSRQIEENLAIIHDSSEDQELREMAKEDNEDLWQKKDEFERHIKIFLLTEGSQ